MPASPETDKSAAVQLSTPYPRTSSYLARYGVSSVLAHLALCLGTAVMLTLAFPRPGWSFMAYFALVPVGVLVMRTTRLWRLAWTSYIVFVGWWALRLIWLQEISPFAPVGVALVCGGYFTVALVGLAAVQRRFRGSMAVTLPVFWCAQEALRGRFPWGGFNWFNLSASQANWQVGQPAGYIVQSADLFGELTVSFLVAMTSGLVVDIVARPLSKRNKRGRAKPRRTIVVAAVLWFTMIGGAFLYGRYRVAQTAELVTAGPVVTVVQTNIPQSNKVGSTEQQRIDRINELFDLTEQAIQQNPDTTLVVWPETMLPYPVNREWVSGQRVYMNEKSVLLHERLSDFARRWQINLLVGSSSAIVEPGTQEVTERNSAFLYTPTGQYLDAYSKRRLVPFGEFVPGGPLKPTLLSWFAPRNPSTNEPIDYSIERGQATVVFPVQGYEAVGGTLPIVTPICFEDVVGPYCLEMVYGRGATKRAEALVNITNDGWFAGTAQGYQHLQIATLRSIETRTPTARSVNTGVSGFIDSAGRVEELVTVDGQQQQVAGYASRRLMLDPRVSPYATTRQGLTVGVCAAAGLLLIGIRVPPRVARKTKRAEADGKQ